MLARQRRFLSTPEQDPYGDIRAAYPDALIYDFAAARPACRGRPYFLKDQKRGFHPRELGGWSYTKSGLLLFQRPDGQWDTRGANDDTIMPGDGGLPVYEATTNKCTNYNAAPNQPVGTVATSASPNGINGVTVAGDAAGVVSIVDDTLNLMAAGYGALIAAGRMNGLVLEIDARSSSSNFMLTYNGSSGNTNPHSGSIVSRHLDGLGATLTSSNAAWNQNISNSATYVRTVAENKTPANSGTSLRIVLNPGCRIRVCLNQLEEKAYATPPVIVSGASASRGAGSANVSSLGALLTYPFVAFVSGDMSAIDGTTRYLMELSDGGVNNRLAFSRESSGSALVTPVVSGAVGTARGNTSKTGARRLSISAFCEADGFTAFTDGVMGGAGKAVTPMPTITQLTAGGRPTVLTVQFNSPILRCGIIPGGSAALAQQLSTAA